MTTPPTNDMLLAAAVKDGHLANPEGKPNFKLPEGCYTRELPSHPDDRGLVCELFDPRWDTLEHPFEFCYFWTMRPNVAKGWAMHKVHEDRYCLIYGEMKTVLYDGREDSKTFGQVFEIFLSDERRRMLTIARGVWHVDLNTGDGDTVIVNFPTILYNHESPDKYRLPLHTDLIPYKIPAEFTGG
jgi:dTDP-4-dehydrorhamnose 3,5-epimerase